MNRIIGAINGWELDWSWDRIAMTLSGLCLVHCAATSIMLGLLATAGGVFASPVVHEAGLVLAVLFALIAFTRGVIEHGMVVPSMLGGFGLLAMGGALLAPHGGPETLLTMFGVVLLGIGHWMNRRATA